MLQIRTENIPERGLVMAYFREELLFSSYSIEAGELVLPGKTLFETEDPFECHFFDNRTEYRRIRRASRRDIIERILTKEEEDRMPEDLLFAEDVLVKGKYARTPGIPEKLRVVSRYEYSENDTLVLRDYRMALIDM